MRVTGTSEIIWDTCVAEKCTFRKNPNAHHATRNDTAKSTISNHENKNSQKVKSMGIVPQTDEFWFEITQVLWRRPPVVTSLGA
jgi:ABC-type protease/lipase transport system fused ATPase/permease subunit